MNNIFLILQAICAIFMLISYLIMIVKYIKEGFEEGFIFFVIGFGFYLLNIIFWGLQKLL